MKLSNGNQSQIISNITGHKVSSIINGTRHENRLLNLYSKAIKEWTTKTCHKLETKRQTQKWKTQRENYSHHWKASFKLFCRITKEKKIQLKEDNNNNVDGNGDDGDGDDGDGDDDGGGDDGDDGDDGGLQCFDLVLISLSVLRLRPTLYAETW